MSSEGYPLQALVRMDASGWPWGSWTVRHTTEARPQLLAGLGSRVRWAISFLQGWVCRVASQFQLQEGEAQGGTRREGTVLTRVGWVCKVQGGTHYSPGPVTRGSETQREEPIYSRW